MKKILKYASLFIFSIAVILIASYRLYTSLTNNPKEEKHAADIKQQNIQTSKSVIKNDEIYFDETLNINGSKPNLANEGAIYEIIHMMANTKVVADVTYATMDIKSDRVNALIKAVNRSNWNDKSRLIEILNRWKVGDFSQCVDDHNYVWAKLGGEIGKATELKK
ncbi:DUF6241 domain-containing protein [Candidatus Clostridium stratigraminis]|uniref:DUF6241 domain-containing protein n=1 Tax=Candidatus Clostridium stratigraminis TaxID=3381661 RepID=A0ABW8T9X0_9CLOT